MTRVLEVDGVSKAFPTPADPLVVLEGVSLVAGAGERLVVTGPSGSGKSTLLAILGGLEPPTAGHVSVAGVDPFRLSAAGRAAFRNQRIGFVFQEHHLLESCTALENVLLPVLATGRASAAHVERARLLLDRVGLASRERHLPAELSGGERQRVAVARAVMREPMLLLADEPTGQLDSQAATGVVDVLTGMVEETGSLLLVVTHDEQIASRVAGHPQGRRLHMLDGRLLP